MIVFTTVLFFLSKIYLFLAAPGLCRDTRAFSGRSKRGLFFVVLRLLTVVTSLVAEHHLWGMQDSADAALRLRSVARGL